MPGRVILSHEEVVVAGRKIHSAEEARACLSAAANSGLEPAAWARQNL